jgi:multidrug efflux pump
MNWFKACINHKLTIYLIAIALSLFGLFSAFTIPITPFPLPSSQSISINFSYPGANASAVQAQVVDKVSNALQSLQNVKYMQATTQASKAEVDLELESAKPLAELQTQVDINQAISSANLPTIVPSPEIVTSQNNSGLVSYAITASKWSLFQLQNFIHASLYPIFRSIPGVIIQTSTENPEVKIKIHPEELAQFHLTPINISQLINTTYQTNPLGAIHIQRQRYQLELADNLNSLDSFRNLIVGYQNGDQGEPIYLKQLANIAFQPQNIIHDHYSSYNGQKAEGLTLLTHGVSDPFKDSQITHSFVKQLANRLPNWIQFHTVYDAAATMHTAINEVIFTIVVATILVLIIALIFLGHFRTTIIPIVVVPICLLGTIAIISLMGFSLNLLTLLALVIAVGLVVDDAIVVIENITRHLEMGLSKMDAILEGTADIALTIIGITLTLIAVYLPITFAHGALVFFLTNFALPLATAVLLSGILSLTLTPVMAVTFISDKPQNNYQKKFSKVIDAAVGLQHRVLEVLLKAPFLSLGIIILIVMIGGYYAVKVPQGLFPADPNNQVSVSINGTLFSTVKSLQKDITQFKQFYTAQTVNYYKSQIEKDPNTGNLQASITISYYPKYLHQDAQFASNINDYIKSHNIKNTFAKMDKFLNSGSGSDLDVTLYGSDDTRDLNKIVDHVTKILQKSPMFALVNNTINQPHKQLQFDINSEKAASFGIFRNQISQLLSTYYGGSQLNNFFKIDGLTVPVVVSLDDQDLTDPSSLQKIEIKSPVTNQLLPLNEFVSFKTIAKPTQITTFNNQPAADLTANLNKAYSIGDAIKLVNQTLAISAPSLKYQYHGQAQEFIEGNSQTILIFVLGLVCVYLLLAILFDSLADPFIIMLTVPFTIVGGALSLYLIDGNLNLFSILGLITLVGLITKHGVLIVQFANDEIKHKNATVKEAILTATHNRFRPIMMTTLAMALGALPLVLSQDLMYVSRQSLGIVIIGGLIIGTLFSLFIIPVVYTLIKRAERYHHKEATS